MSSENERFHCPAKGCQWFGNREDFERHVETIKKEHAAEDEPHKSIHFSKEPISASGTKR